MHSVFFRTVEPLISMQYQYVSRRNVRATMEIIQFVTACSATILDIIIDGVETTLYTVAYLSFGIWMQRCKLTWWNRLSGIASWSLQNAIYCTGLFISPSGTSELDCATTKTDTAERSISIGRESLKVFFVLGALVYLQVPPLGGSRDEKWRAQWIRKRSVSWNLPTLSQLWRCNGGFGPCTAQNHLRTKQFVSGTW